MVFTKFLLFFAKELNKNKSKISRVFFSIFISLLVFSSVTILNNSVENIVKNNARILLGADVELSTKNKALDLNLLEELKESFFMTKVIEFTSIVRTESQASKTSRIKVIDNFYPLVGKVIVEPSNSLEILKATPNTILIDKTSKSNLDLELGQKIKIQNTSFEIVGVIESLPDIGGFFFWRSSVNK